MTLGDKQRLFTRLVGLLIEYAYQQGYELTLGEAFRTPEQAALNAKNDKGITNSLHTQRLAIDLNLFRNDVYLNRSEDHIQLGTFWKSLHPECCWGGDFKSMSDGNHYSLSHGGFK